MDDVEGVEKRMDDAEAKRKDRVEKRKLVVRLIPCKICKINTERRIHNMSL